MGRSPCCSRVGLRRGPWSAKEDTLLASCIQLNGEGQWRSLPKKAGLLRCGKSCRLRWMNYLRPGIKRGNISEDEEDLIVRLHGLLGNRWSLIAGRLPGRTDNEIKNYWNTHLLKKMKNNNKKLTAAAAAAAPAPVKKRKPQKKADKSTAAAEAKKDDNNNNNRKMEEEEMKSTTKVYLPKPLRVSSALPRTESYDSFASGSSSSEVAPVEVLVSAWPTPPLFEIDDPALLYLYSGDDNVWEKVYAEYLQLL